MNPLTGQLLGAGTTGLIGQRIIGTGSQTNGIKQQGQGISKYNFKYPFLEIGPRVGVAYLLRPDGKLILRGGFGMFFDRVEGNFTMSQSANPPTAESTTLYYSFLQNVGQGRHLLRGRPHAEHLPVCQPEPPHGSRRRTAGCSGSCRTSSRSTPPTSGSIRMTRWAARGVPNSRT